MLNGSMIIERKVDKNDNTLLKFEDGTMVYYKRFVKTVTCNMQYGSGMWRCGSFEIRRYLEEFKDLPIISAQVIDNSEVGNLAFCLLHRNRTRTIFPKCIVLCPYQDATMDIIVMAIAIGRWK